MLSSVAVVLSSPPPLLPLNLHTPEQIGFLQHKKAHKVLLTYHIYGSIAGFCWWVVASAVTQKKCKHVGHTEEVGAGRSREKWGRSEEKLGKKEGKRASQVSGIELDWEHGCLAVLSKFLLLAQISAPLEGSIHAPHSVFVCCSESHLLFAFSCCCCWSAFAIASSSACTSPPCQSLLPVPNHQPS